MIVMRRIWLLLLILSHGMPMVVLAQDDSQRDPIVIDLDKIKNDMKRDEVQRYFGYEDLLYRYLTLPYDVSSNTNQQGRYVDLGFTLLMLLPLTILGVLYRKPRFFYTLIVLLILYLCLCLSFSFFFTPSHGQLFNHGANWDDYIAHAQRDWRASISTAIFIVSYHIAQPLLALGKMISGNTDHWSYPLLAGMLIMAIWMAVRKMGLSPMLQLISIVGIAYGYLWLLLSAGILWYGFLMIPLGYAIIAYFSDIKKLHHYKGAAVIKYVMLVVLITWIVMAWVGRVSNINSLQSVDPNNIGKAIVDNNSFLYSTGLIEATEARARSYRGINDALDKINSNDALIFQVGTFLAFDIKKNQERMLMDNTLEQFYWLLNTIKDKEAIVQALKDTGFKYILVDFYTHTLDKTPEKSLTKKYQLFLNTLYRNPRVKLIATDRVIEVPRLDGTFERTSEVFGEKIINFGSYAIYEIL